MIFLLFQKMANFNCIDESYVEDNPLPASKSKMQLVLNKCRPYLSSLEDEQSLIKCLNDLGVECVDHLKLLDFEVDLQGILKVIQCRQLEHELSKGIVKFINLSKNIHILFKIADVTIHESINITKSSVHDVSYSSLENERSQLSIVLGFTIPKFRKSIRISLDKTNLRNDERLHVVETGSNNMFDVIR